MTPEVQNLLADLVKWIIKLVGDAAGAAGKPAPTKDELQALVAAYIADATRDPNWIAKLGDAALAQFVAP
jgi:hypothetical protein